MGFRRYDTRSPHTKQDELSRKPLLELGKCHFMLSKKTRRPVWLNLTFTPLVLSALLFAAGCSSLQEKKYILQLDGAPGTICEITSGQQVVGTFSAPSSVELDSGVSTLNARCKLGDRSVQAKIQTPEADCLDKVVINGECPSPKITNNSVEIHIRHRQSDY